VEGTSHCKVWGHFAAIYAKTAEPIEMPFELGSDGPNESCVRRGSKSPMGWAILVERGARCKV